MNKRLLLDSHAFLWAVADPAQLGRAAYEAIQDGLNAVYVSTASLWELLLKASKGKLDLGIHPPQRLASFVAGLHAMVLPVRFEHVVEAYSLPGTQPFDRILIGQARTEELVLVTKDRTIGRYDVQILW